MTPNCPNKLVFQILSTTECLNNVWDKRTESGRPSTPPRELEDRRDQAYTREPKPNLRLRGRLTRIIWGTQIPTPPQAHKVMAPSTPQPPTPHYPQAHASRPADPPSPSLPHPQPREIDRAPVRNPPSWRLNYKIGTGACGTVFLENVQTVGMKSPELWAVKRIPRALPNFTFKRYQAEINNLQLVSRVSLPGFASFYYRPWSRLI